MTTCANRTALKQESTQTEKVYKDLEEASQGDKVVTLFFPGLLSKVGPCCPRGKEKGLEMCARPDWRRSQSQNQPC